MIKSLRIKLDDFISSDNEKLIMENLRRCRYFAGKEFSLILWNETLEEKDVKAFFKKYTELLFFFQLSFCRGTETQRTKNKTRWLF